MHSSPLGQHLAVVGGGSTQLRSQSSSNGPYSVLLINGDPSQARSSQRALLGSDSCFVVDWAKSLPDAAARLEERRFDVLVCDLALSQSTGIDTVTAIRKLQPDTPLVVLTSQASERLALAALDPRARDCVARNLWVAESGSRGALGRVIRYALHRRQAANQMHKSNRQLRRSQKILKDRNKRLAGLYQVAQHVVENVSHDFRTPLTVIKEYTSLIRDGAYGEVTTEQNRVLDIIADRSDDLNRMVDDMLDVSKIDAGLLTVRRAEHDLAEIIRHVLFQLERKAALKEVALVVDLERELPKVYCDADKVGRTIVNLMVNAITVCHKSGMVRLSARFAQHAHEVVIEITDNGPGILERDLQRIFTRFTQVDMTLRDGSKGFGLGLSIAKELVDLNLGRITATSRVGAGSSFAFTLPTTDPVEITRRFLSRTEMARSQESSRTSLGIVWTEDDNVDVHDDIEPLLHYMLRANDLVVRLTPQLWIVLLRANADGFEKFRLRIAQVLKETNRNRLGGHPLPPLFSSLIGTWDVREHAEIVLAKVDELAHAKVGLPA